MKHLEEKRNKVIRISPQMSKRLNVFCFIQTLDIQISNIKLILIVL
jgi:hypothetical protein